MKTNRWWSWVSRNKKTVALALLASLVGHQAYAAGLVVPFGADPADIVLPDLTSAVAISSHTCPEYGYWSGLDVRLTGEHSMALLANGTLAAWDYGGSGMNGSATVPVPAGLSNVVGIAAGLGYRLVLQGDGTVHAWATSTNPSTMSLAEVPAGLTNVVRVAAGDLHWLALKADGTVFALGDNSAGEAAVPAGLADVVDIAAGPLWSLALKADGTVVGWGDNVFGQLDIPAGLSNVVAIAAGQAHCIALRADGTVVSWGQYQRYGYGWVWDAMFYRWVYRYTCLEQLPAFDPPFSNIVAVAATRSHNLGLRADGTVAGWGVGETNLANGISNVVAIADGAPYALALVGEGPPASRAAIASPGLDAKGFGCLLPTQSGRVYRLEYKDSLAVSAWTALPLVAGNGGRQTLTDPAAGGGQRYYRVRQW